MSQRGDTKSGIEALNHWLIRRAARQAPLELRSRLEEEWLADLQYRSSALSGIRLALGCCWAARVVAHEFRQSATAATPLTISSVATAANARPLRYLTLRPATLFLILGLHAALFWGLASLLPDAP